jgi:hypothetical protein
VRAAHRDDLTPDADELAARSLHTVLLRSVHEERGSVDRAVSIDGAADGVYVSWTEPGDRPHVRARLGRADLEAFALDLILGDMPKV